jgi:hypothetical protein
VREDKKGDGKVVIVAVGYDGHFIQKRLNVSTIFLQMEIY